MDRDRISVHTLAAVRHIQQHNDSSKDSSNSSSTSSSSSTCIKAHTLLAAAQRQQQQQQRHRKDSSSSSTKTAAALLQHHAASLCAEGMYTATVLQCRPLHSRQYWSSLTIRPSLSTAAEAVCNVGLPVDAHVCQQICMQARIGTLMISR